MKDWRNAAGPGGIGGGNCPDPPELTEHDEACLAWFNRYGGPFSKDYGLSVLFFRELDFDPEEEVIFLRKLNLIYAARVHENRECLT